MSAALRMGRLSFWGLNHCIMGMLFFYGSRHIRTGDREGQAILEVLFLEWQTVEMSGSKSTLRLTFGPVRFRQHLRRPSQDNSNCLSHISGDPSSKVYRVRWY